MIEVHKFPRFSRVNAPVLAGETGVGTVDAYIIPIGGPILGVLVRLDRRDYTKALWGQISPLNAPCKFVRFSEDELSEVLDSATARTPTPIEETTPATIVDAPSEPEEEVLPTAPEPIAVLIPAADLPTGPELHQIWKSTRGPSRYEIVEIEGPDIVLKEVGISYKRDSNWTKLQKGYTYEGMDE